MYKRVIVLVILVIKAKSVGVPEECMSEEEFNEKHNAVFKKVYKQRDFRVNLIPKENGIWKSLFNYSLLPETRKSIVVKEVSKTKESPRRTRVIN